MKKMISKTSKSLQTNSYIYTPMTQTIYPPAQPYNLDELSTREQALLTLEAMRLGVVPATDLEKSTVGRSIELEIIEDDLKNVINKGGARRAFLGEYGVGKSHLLEIIQQKALKQNFLVTKVVLDHDENAPSHPKRVYNALMKNLQYPDNPRNFAGLKTLLQKAIACPKALEQFCVQPKPKNKSIREQLNSGLHLYLSTAIAYFKALDEDINNKTFRNSVHIDDPEQWKKKARHRLLDWIEGHPTLSNQDLQDDLNVLRGSFPKVYSLLDFRPWAKIYGYIINGISQLAKSVGYNGLVIVIDEAEFYSLLSSQNRLFAKYLFQAWSHAVGTQSNNILPFSKEELLTGGYGIQRELPTTYVQDPGLYLVYAMTPNTEGVRVLNEAIPPQLVCHLNPLSPYDYNIITNHVVNLYATAYPQNPPPEGIQNPLASVINGLIEQAQFTNPRQAMKFLTEFLDIVRFNPNEVINVIRNLQMHCSDD